MIRTNCEIYNKVIKRTNTVEIVEFNDILYAF